MRARRDRWALLTLLASVAALALPQGAMASTGVKFVKTFGEFSDGLGIATDADRNIYVADRGANEVQKFDSNGNPLTDWDTPGPWGLAVDADTVYVADQTNDQVRRFDTDGNFIDQWGVAGTDPGEFQDPIGVTIDAGIVYVSDDDRDVVLKFTPAGTFLDEFGEGALARPNGLDVDRGILYLADEDNDNAERFSLDGTLLTPLNEPGTLVGAAGVAADRAGDLYVSQCQSDRISKFAPSGELLDEIGSEGSDPGQLSCPVHIATDSKGGIYVVEEDNGRVSKFKDTLRLKAKAKHKQELGKLTVKVRCPEEPCDVVAKGKASAGDVKAKLKKRKKSLDAGERKKLRLKPKGDKDELLDALRDDDGKAKIKVRGTDDVVVEKKKLKVELTG